MTAPTPECIANPARSCRLDVGSHGPREVHDHPMTAPTPEQVDAGSGVRFALNDVLDVIATDFVVRDGEPMSDIERETVAFVLTTPNPAAQAAIAASLPAEVMLGALVRAGVLTEDRERLVRACGCIANEEPAACCDPTAPPHWERRYATRWEVAP